MPMYSILLLFIFFCQILWVLPTVHLSFLFPLSTCYGFCLLFFSVFFCSLSLFMSVSECHPSVFHCSVSILAIWTFSVCHGVYFKSDPVWAVMVGCLGVPPVLAVFVSTPLSSISNHLSLPQPLNACHFPYSHAACVVFPCADFGVYPPVCLHYESFSPWYYYFVYPILYLLVPSQTECVGGLAFTHVCLLVG